MFSASAGAQTLVDSGNTAPTPGAADIFQFSTAGNETFPGGLNYYTDNQTDHGAGEPGQTFATGIAPNGFTLTSVAIKTAGLGSDSGIGTAKSYVLHLYTLSGGNVTLLTNFTSAAIGFSDGDWLQWTGLSVALAGGANYAWSFGKASSGGGWEAMAVAGGNPYAGGQIGLFSPAGGAVNFGTNLSFDAVFDLGLVSNTPPVLATLTNLPATSIQPFGAALNGSVISSGGSLPSVTVFYGTNNAGTNAAAWSGQVALGQQPGNFSATVTNLKANTTYYFTAQASNSAGVSWAQPSLSFTTPASISVPASPTLVTLGSTTPVPGLYDVSQLSTAGDNSSPDGLNYYTDNQSDHGAGEPGQTFTTPGGSAGFILNTLAIKTGGGTTSGTTTPQGYLLHLYAVTNGSALLLATCSATNFAFNDGDWLQWSNLDLAVSANSLYAWSFGKISSAVGGWEAMANAANNPYSGGELGIFPVAGGAITFGASHSYDATFDVGLTSTGPPTVAGITNLPATAIQSIGAALNGDVYSSGGSLPYVTVFYGTNDGTTNVAEWSASVALGSQLGNYSAMVTGLKTNTTYYFAAQASNSAGISWAQPSLSFTTPAAAAPSVTNLPATGISSTFATVNGQVLNTGNEWPVARIYYGPADGGTNPAAWANQFSAGTQTGAIAVQVGGLAASTAYYFTISVSNSAGEAWGGPSQSFTTAAGPKRISVLTYHYDNTRQGQNTNETLLTPANVNVASFGKLFSYAVDGYVYAQPLIMTNLSIPGKGVRNVLFVSTMHDSLYAFDADSNGDTNGGLLWKTNFGASAVSPTTEYGQRYHPGVGNLDVVPEEGTVGTPVIDPASGTIYADAFTREVVPGVSTNYYHRIHALDVTTGSERSYSPVVVSGSVSGTGVNGTGGVAGAGTGATIADGGPTVTFSAIQSCARPALTLAGGTLFVAFGSHDDTDPYHGWVFGYNMTNLALASLYCTTPNARFSAFGSNAGEGAIWQGGNGLCVDANTNLFFETGNGSFSANTNGGDYSDSFVKLSTASNGLAVADYFTPYNQASLQASDSDLGSGGPLLLPDSAGSATHPHLIVGCGKEGKIYLVDRDNMGRFNAAGDTNLEELPGAVGGTWSSPAYFNRQIYYHGNGDVLKAFLVTNATIVAAPSSASTTSFGFPGATPTVSANGTNNGIVWDIDPTAYLSSGPAVLHAYNATNVAIELYNSSQNLARDNPGPAVKMVPPVVAGGKVYVGAQYAVSVFGTAIFLSKPAIAPAGGNFTNSVTVTLSDASAGASIYYTLDGTTPTTGSALYAGPFTLTSNAVISAVAIAPGAVNSAVADASFVNTAAAGSGNGLLGQYYAGATGTNPFSGSPALVTTNANINFSAASGWPGAPVGGANFSVRWTGSVQPQFTENYNFTTIAAGAVRLFLNGQLLINNWVTGTNVISLTNSIPLVAQQLYTIELDYYQTTNNASVSLAWQSPSTPYGIVPQSQLYPFTNPPPSVVITAPANGAAYTASASVTLSADADAPYNPLSMVSFYAGTNFVGSVSNAPYTLTTTGLPAGNYSFTAVATDASGLGSTSAAVNVTVNAGGGQPYGLAGNPAVPAFFSMPATFGGAIPAQLSLTGVFSNTPAMAVTSGLIPYAPNTPLWSDGALKTRYLAVPGHGGGITPDEQITFSPTNYWTFPAGTVFVKTFQLNTDTSNPGVLRRLETRLLVRDINGAVYGVTYKWRPDNSDADLLSNSLTENILITNATGVTTQTWYYPSPSDCLTCHTPVANYVLGVNARQLNAEFTYGATGVTDNQLRTLNRLGLFNPAFDESTIPGFPQLSAITNLVALPEQRVRSYLDANCAQCHQPGGTGPAFDARYTTPLASQNLINGSPGSGGLAMIVPQDIWRSEIHQRMDTTNPATRMPPLARNLIDTNAVQVLEDWINSLPGTPAEGPPAITPNGGSYFNSVTVALAAPDTNAAIYYTLDGSAPTTNGLLYSGPFNLAVNAVVSASAFRTNYNNSLAASAVFSVTPLYFTTEGFQTNRQFQLNFTGVPGSNYVLQASTNLTTWIPVSTNLAGTNAFILFDAQATNYPLRFYRVLQQ